jgi:hypothetical protein
MAQFPRMRETGDRDEGSRTVLQELTEVIDVAAKLAESLAADRTLQRLIDALRTAPLEDRDTIVGAIEREVQARRLSRATEDLTGQSMHPNPHARLYIRSHETVVPRNLLERDELMLAMLSGMRVSPILLTPDIHAAWVEGTREALEHLDPTARAAVAQLLREALALVEEASQSTESEGRTARAS